MSHTPSEYMFRLRSQYRNRINYLYLADKLLSHKIIEFDFRNAIDIRYFIIGKFVIPQMKYKKDEYFVSYPFICLKKRGIYMCETLIESFSEMESRAREILRGRQDFP